MPTIKPTLPRDYDTVDELTIDQPFDELASADIDQDNIREEGLNRSHFVSNVFNTNFSRRLVNINAGIGGATTWATVETSEITPTPGGQIDVFSNEVLRWHVNVFIDEAIAEAVNNNAAEASETNFYLRVQLETDTGTWITVSQPYSYSVAHTNADSNYTLTYTSGGMEFYISSVYNLEIPLSGIIIHRANTTYTRIRLQFASDYPSTEVYFKNFLFHLHVARR